MAESEQKKKFRIRMMFSSIMKVFFIALIFAIIILSLTIPIFGLKLMDSAKTLDQNGYVHLIGEVKNDGPNPIDNVYATGILYGKNNSQLGNFSNQVDVHRL